MAALLNKMDRQDVTVAVDGSLYRFHPHFHDLMVEKIQQLVKPGIKVKMECEGDWIKTIMGVNVMCELYKFMYFQTFESNDFEQWYWTIV